MISKLKDVLQIILMVLASLALVFVIAWGVRAENAIHQLNQINNDPTVVPTAPVCPDGEVC
jgi:flagellar basal body-associated protein FliL